MLSPGRPGHASGLRAAFHHDKPDPVPTNPGPYHVTHATPARRVRRRSRRPRPAPRAAGRTAPVLLGVEHRQAEVDGLEVGGDGLHRVAAGIRDDREGPAAVGGVGHPLDEPLGDQPLHDVGGTGRVHHQPLADPRHRQPALAAEREQHQRLVAGEGETVPAGDRVELADEQLLHPHHRGGGGHRRRARVLAPAAAPQLARPGDRVERQAHRLAHTEHRSRPGSGRPSTISLPTRS